jgi:hypothetical protein
MHCGSRVDSIERLQEDQTCATRREFVSFLDNFLPCSCFLEFGMKCSLSNVDYETGDEDWVSADDVEEE